MKNSRLKTLIIVVPALLFNANIAWAKHHDHHKEEKVKDFIDDAASSLKKAVDELGENYAALQDYLDNYHWKGMVQDEATSEPATLKHLLLNGHSRAVAVKPGERIEGVVECTLDPNKVSAFSLYRVVLGIKGEGAQTTIANELGLTARQSIEKFDLIAPSKPGLYQIRFKVVEAAFERSALDAWKDENGKEPDGTKTIGVILVK